MENLITSQSFIDDETVAEKIAAADFEVFVSPEFEIDGVTYRVIMDGHHSFAAALESGAEMIITEQNATDNDNIGLLKDGKTEDFLNACWMDSDYHFAASGKAVWG